MSKESKPRDLWRQVFASAHTRHPKWCKGCGMYFAVHGVHRADCTRTDHDIAVQLVQTVLGGRVIHTKIWAGRSGNEGE